MCIGLTVNLMAQDMIPMDTATWQINAKSYVLEKYKGKDAIYLQGGTAVLKDKKFKNGTIEFDIYLTERAGFPGVYFRGKDFKNYESFYIRPHQSGNPDANQGAPVINGITAWQLYFGPSYSVAYDYKFDDWTHIKLVVNEDQAQVYFDNAEQPHLSWRLIQPVVDGAIAFGGGGAPFHFANFKIDPSKTEIVDFNPYKRKPIERLIQTWEISDMFEEKLLNDPNKVSNVIADRSWGREISVEEGTAANISRQQVLFDGSKGNTVFTKIKITSKTDQIKLFEFGYSDRVVAILNGEAIYRGNNRWKSRDYRYLGTIGLFDAIYLNLKKGENTLMFAVSEDFGGWLITGRFEDEVGLKLK